MSFETNVLLQYVSEYKFSAPGPATITILSDGSLEINQLTMPNPVAFSCFKASPEMIQLTVMLYVSFPRSLRNVEDQIHERAVDLSDGPEPKLCKTSKTH
jgi:hypothetical protein